MREVPLSEAKARFAEIVREAEEGELILLTRHGRPAAALVRPDNIERLERLEAAGPAGGLASLAGGWEGSEELVLVVAERPRTAYRIVPGSEEQDG